jgi:hypothetical protein
MAGVMFASSPALATPQMTTGVVKSVDASNHHLVLMSGETFALSNASDAAALKAGDKALVTFDMKDGKMKASKVSVEK